MRQTSKQGFTLVELLVVIAIIGTLVGLLLPAVQAAREAARSNTCRSNMTQLQKALAQRESSLGGFPGYINNLGVKGTVNQVRASWIVTCFPYLEQNALWEAWSQPQTTVAADFLSPAILPPLEILVCPSDPPVLPGQPSLSYAANAGFLQRTQSQLPFGSEPAPRENPANGVFFDLSRVPQSPAPAAPLVGPQDTFDSNGVQAPAMTMAYIQQKGDGSTSTILLTENIHQVFWAYSEVNDYTASGSATTDEKFHFGVVWESPDIVVDPMSTDDEKARRMNGDLREDTYELVSDITSSGFRHAMPTALHPAGVNIAFVGGSVRFVSDQIEPRIYCQLMTSNRNRSDLFFGGVQEANLAPVSDTDF